MNIKVGIGYDIHCLVEGRPLYIGGVKIPFSRGLLGHSDGDCLVHALADALLGAVGVGDIGQLFPDVDPRYKDIRSALILDKVVAEMKGKGGEILNIDSLILAQEPRLAEFVPQMKKTLCPILGIEETALGIKPRTHEGLGEIGRGEAMAAWAVVLIQTKD